MTNTTNNDDPQQHVRGIVESTIDQLVAVGMTYQGALDLLILQATNRMDVDGSEIEAAHYRARHGNRVSGHY